MKNNDFVKQNEKKTNLMANDKELNKLSRKWFDKSFNHEYSYHFSWLGRPIIQYPQDMIAIQEIIWKTKPDLIIETGIAHGGSLIYSASILEIIGNGKVLGIDIDIRKHNRKEIEKHSLKKRIIMLEGSSLDENILKKVKKYAKNKKRILLFLDSFHTNDHVLKELEMYSPLVKKGGYIVIFDTIIEFISEYDINSNTTRAFLHDNNRDDILNKFIER